MNYSISRESVRLAVPGCDTLRKSAGITSRKRPAGAMAWSIPIAKAANGVTTTPVNMMNTI